MTPTAPIRLGPAIAVLTADDQPTGHTWKITIGWDPDRRTLTATPDQLPVAGVSGEARLEVYQGDQLVDGRYVTGLGTLDGDTIQLRWPDNLAPDPPPRWRHPYEATLVD